MMGTRRVFYMNKDFLYMTGGKLSGMYQMWMVASRIDMSGLSLYKVGLILDKNHYMEM